MCCRKPFKLGPVGILDRLLQLCALLLKLEDLRITVCYRDRLVGFETTSLPMTGIRFDSM